jgi:hypothetical protein
MDLILNFSTSPVINCFVEMTFFTFLFLLQISACFFFVVN